jgi:hypothetical protein
VLPKTENSEPMKSYDPHILPARKVWLNHAIIRNESIIGNAYCCNICILLCIFNISGDVSKGTEYPAWKETSDQHNPALAHPVIASYTVDSILQHHDQTHDNIDTTTSAIGQPHTSNHDDASDDDISFVTLSVDELSADQSDASKNIDTDLAIRSSGLNEAETQQFMSPDSASPDSVSPDSLSPESVSHDSVSHDSASHDSVLPDSAPGRHLVELSYPHQPSGGNAPYVDDTSIVYPSHTRMGSPLTYMHPTSMSGQSSSHNLSQLPGSGSGSTRSLQSLSSRAKSRIVAPQSLSGPGCYPGMTSYSQDGCPQLLYGNPYAQPEPKPSGDKTKRQKGRRYHKPRH